MQVNMTTFGGRPRHYIHETLQSLFSSDWHQTNLPVNLIMGSNDESHVKEYAAHASIRIVPWDLETNANLRWNCTLNKIRALRHGEGDATLVCEDDIQFHPNWVSTLERVAAELPDEEYVLSLFAAQLALEKEPLLAGKAWIKRYPGQTLQGAQALYYPTRAIRTKVAEYLKFHLTQACGDDLIGQYAKAQAALYATKETLVEHIGEISCFPP